MDPTASKSIFTSKTFWVNFLTGIVTVAGEASGAIPPAWAPYIAAAVTIANVLLLLITPTPVHVIAPADPAPPAPKQSGSITPGILAFLLIATIFLAALLGLT